MKHMLLKPSALPVFCLLLFCLLEIQVQAQTVKTYVSTDSLTIGEKFEYSLTLQLDQEYNNIVFPDTNAFPPSVDLIEKRQYKLSEFSDSLVYSMQFFGNEDLEISSLPVSLYAIEDSSEIYSDPVTLYFKTVVAEGDSTFKSMRDIFEFPRALWPWILAALLLGGFAYWWFMIREQDEQDQKEEKPEIEPFYNPLEELEKTLVAIKEDSDIAQTKDFKSFYTAVGDAIRRYFEDLYNIPALESTSTELLRYLDAYGVDEELIGHTRKVLRKADLVKFAKFTPTLDDAFATHDVAMDFLERAKIADNARIRRLRADYNQQFVIPTSKENQENA